MSHDKDQPLSVFSSLRGRLLFLICLATLPAILFTFFVAKNERSSVLARMERDAIHLAQLASREHAHQIRGAVELLFWLGQKLGTEGLQSPIVADPSLLRALLAGHPQLANIGVLSPDGNVLASAYPLASYRSWKDNPAYIAALRAPDVVSGTYITSPIFERPTINHAYAVRDSTQTVIAVLFTGLDLDWLSGLTTVASLPDGFSLFITDRQGRVFSQGGHVHTELTTEGAARISSVAALSESGHARMVQVGDAQLTLVAARLEGTKNMFIVIGMPYDRALAQANTSFYRVLSTLGLLTLFVVAATLIGTELSILRGLRALARVAQRFGAGETQARATVPRRNGEIGFLATAFNRMADALAARHREALDAQVQLRALAGRLQEAREAEATRISRELHDEIGQTLTSLKIDLSRLRSACPAEAQEQPCAVLLRESTAAMSRHIDEAVAFVRRIAADLRPGVLDQLGLVAAIEWQARETERRTELAIQVEADFVDGGLDELVSVTLFRIMQEALNNVVRHAEAHLVEITLTRTKEQVILTVRDDGKGITAGDLQNKRSLGIMGMRERAVLISGELSVHGSPTRGTTVRVAVPLLSQSKGTDAHLAG